MARLYEVLFYNGWQDVPAYYLVSSIEGRRPKEALRRHIERVIQDVRDQFGLGDEVEDYWICDSLYALRDKALLSASEVIEP